MPSSVAFLLLGAASAQQESGVQDQCIGASMHQIEYTMSGTRDENNMPADFSISVAPVHGRDAECGANGQQEKNVCVGVNTDDCQSAKAATPINSFLTCSNCFAGFSTDFFYDLDVEDYKLKKAAIGFQNSKVLGALELTAQQSAQKTVSSGTFSLLGDKEHQISFTVAGTIPISIGLKLPTDIDYSVTLSDSVNVKLGASLDVELGDHSVQWTDVNGWETPTSSPSLTFTPSFSAEGEVAVDAPLAMRSELQVSFQKVLDYSLHMTPSLPTVHAETKSDWWHGTQICATSDAELEAHHEARLHYEVFGHDFEFSHFGPDQLFDKHWAKVFDKCFDLSFAQQTVV